MHYGVPHVTLFLLREKERRLDVNSCLIECTCILIFYFVEWWRGLVPYDVSGWCI